MVADEVFDFAAEIGVLFKILFGVFAALPEQALVIAVEGAAFLDDAEVGAEVDDFAGFTDAVFVKHDVEFGFAEGRGDFILGDADAGAVADVVAALLNRLDAADIEAYAGVELEGAPAGGGFWRTEHDADLLAELVGEHDDGVGLLDGAGELAQGLAHEAGLQADMAGAHLAFDFGAGHERGDAVDDDYVEGAGADERLGDFKRLFAGIGL